MKEKNLRVAVIGGGMGGLCLAQGLKKAGVSVAVYERDEAPDSRTQGYRIHIDPQGSTAIQRCLPKDLWEVFEATGGVFSRGFTVITEQLQVLLSLMMNDAAAGSPARHRSITLAGDENYLILALGGRPDYFQLPKHVGVVSQSVLKDVLRRAAKEWHPDLRKLIEIVDEKELFVNRLRTSRPVPPWTASRITLLGDAVHSMTPYRGIGGNIALKDAALLAAKLAGANRGEKPVIDAIAEYETAMREYGFAAVEDSRKAMEQFTGEKKAPVFPMIKAGMRLVNAMPPLKRRLARGAA